MLAPPEVRTAFSGETDTIVHDGTASPVGSFAGQQIAVAVPMYRPGRTQPFAVAEILLPYAPVAQSASRITGRIDYILIGAAVLFYAALLPRLYGPRARCAARPILAGRRCCASSSSE